MARPPPPLIFVPAIRPGTAMGWSERGIALLNGHTERGRRTGTKTEEEQLRETHLCLFIGS